MSSIEWTDRCGMNSGDAFDDSPEPFEPFPPERTETKPEDDRGFEIMLGLGSEEDIEWRSQYVQAIEAELEQGLHKGTLTLETWVQGVAREVAVVTQGDDELFYFLDLAEQVRSSAEHYGFAVALSAKELYQAERESWRQKDLGVLETFLRQRGVETTVRTTRAERGLALEEWRRWPFRWGPVAGEAASPKRHLLNLAFGSDDEQIPSSAGQDVCDKAVPHKGASSAPR